MRYGSTFLAEISNDLRAAHAFQVVVNTYRVCCERRCPKCSGRLKSTQVLFMPTHGGNTVDDVGASIQSGHSNSLDCASMSSGSRKLLSPTPTNR
jgi:hypothetical protein